MLKKLSLFMILIMIVCFFVGCNSGTYSNNTKSEELSAEELSAEEIKYNEAIKYIEDGEYYSALDIINELGDYKDCKALKENFLFVCTKRTRNWSDNNKTSTEHIYTYDENGNTLTVELIDLETGKSLGITSYFYNSDNQLTEKVPSTGSATTYTYDTNGNLIVEEKPNGAKNEFEYDAVGNCIKEVHVDANGEKKTVYNEYDANGYCVKKVTITFDGVGETTEEYTYDDKGNVIKEKSTTVINTNKSGYSPIESEFETKYVYNADGLVEKSSRYNQDGKQIGETLYTYDKYGNEVKVEQQNLITYEEYELLYIAK